jgi:hypothetical protein
MLRSGVEKLGWNAGIGRPLPALNARVDRASSSARAAIGQAPTAAEKGAWSAVIAVAEVVKAKG